MALEERSQNVWKTEKLSREDGEFLKKEKVDQIKVSLGQEMSGFGHIF